MYRSNDNLKKDNELADFADRLLSGGMDRPASTSDEELVGLEETLLHLAEFAPQKTIIEEKANRMLSQIKSRAKREEEPVRQSFWSRFFDFQSNLQVGLLVGVAAIVILAVVVIPAPQTSDSTLVGTALSGSSLVPVLGILAVLFVLYWISRRK